jgi:transcriptional regulator with XRE-family HTH domain
MDGAKLKRLRIEAGLTMREVSIRSGITEGQIFCIERGDTKNPRIDTASALANAIGCDLADLLDEDE